MRVHILVSAKEATEFVQSVLENEGIPKTELARAVGVHRNNIHLALQKDKPSRLLEKMVESLGYEIERVYRIKGTRNRARRSIYGLTEVQQ